jgi:hypothetical protein
MGKRYLSPFTDIKPQIDVDLPYIRGSRVLIKDPKNIERLSHIAKPFRGGDTIDYKAQEKHINEPVYVDLEMLCNVLLDEVVHLRTQIGLICDGAFTATGQQFRIVPDKDVYITHAGHVEGATPRIEHYVVPSKKNK